MEVPLPYFVTAKVQKLSELCKCFLNYLAVNF